MLSIPLSLFKVIIALDKVHRICMELESSGEAAIDEIRDEKEYYKILGITKLSKIRPEAATIDDINKGYLKNVFIPPADGSIDVHAKAVLKAYSVLSDDRKRHDYDKEGRRVIKGKLWWILGKLWTIHQIKLIHEQLYRPFRDKVGPSGLVVDGEKYFVD